MQPRNHNANFSLLFTGQLVSQFGDSVFLVAMLWMALELTGSKTISALIVSIGYLPAILFSLVAGVLADRIDRRKMMIGCAAIQTVVVGALPFLNHWQLLSVATLAIISFGLSAGSAFFNPAKDALIPHLVEPERLNWANSLIKVSGQLAFLAGPVAAGLLVSLVGTINLFSIDAGTFLFSVLTLSLIRISKTTAPTNLIEPVPPPQVPPATGGTLADIAVGLRHAWQDTRLRSLLIITAVDNLLFMGPAILGTPIYVREVLGLGKEGMSTYSFLTGITFAGMIVSSLLIGIAGRSWPKGKLIFCGTILDGLTLVPLAFIHSAGWASGALFFHGMAVPLITVPRTTLIQEIVPDRRRGRVFSLLNLSVVGFTLFSMCLTGIISDRFSMDKIFLGAGILGTLFGLLATRFRSLLAA